MDKQARDALTADPVVDITTYGRKSGTPRRIEIWIHEVADRFYITGSPGRRGWYANLLADPRVIVHLKGSATADLAGRTRPITDPAEKREALLSMGRIERLISRGDLIEWVERSPLVEVTFDGPEEPRR